MFHIEYRSSWSSLQVSLRSGGETIIQVKGTVDVLNGVEVVTSLTFITNKTVHGPYGPTFGNAFETTPNKVVGFFGRSDSLLHQIGVITHLSSSLEHSHHHIFKGGGSKIVKASDQLRETKHVYISHAYESAQCSESHTMSLPYVKQSFSTIIDSGLYNDQQSIQVDGHDTLDVFNEGTPSSQLIGHGTTHGFGDGELSSIALEKSQCIINGKARTSHCKLENEHRFYECGVEHCCCRIHEHHEGLHHARNTYKEQESCQHEEVTIVHGPWGGLRGDLFCDGRGDIVEILIAYNTERVISLQVSYAHGSTTFRGTLHGGRGGNIAKVLKAPYLLNMLQAFHWFWKYTMSWLLLVYVLPSILYSKVCLKSNALSHQ